MKTNKNIDRLFQEKLKDFEVSPPDAVWKDIERRLKNNDSKPLFPLWMRISSVAIIGLIVLISSINYFSDSTKPNKDNSNSITNTDTKKTDEIIVTTIEKDVKKPTLEKQVPPNKFQHKESKQIGEINKSDNKIITTVTSNSVNTRKKDLNTTNSNNVKNTTSIASNLSDKNKENNKTLESSREQIAKVIEQKKSTSSNEKSNDKSTENRIASTTTNNQENALKNLEIDSNVIHFKEETKLANNDSKEESKDLLKDNLTDEDIDKKPIEDKDAKKWSIGSTIASVYYNSFTNTGSPLDSQFNDSPKQGNISMSYGMKISYKLNDKLSLQSGASVVSVGYSVNNVYATPSQLVLSTLANVNYTNTPNALKMNIANRLNNPQIETLSSTSSKGVLTQNLGYIEIPIELKYRLRNSNHKLGVNLVGGFSTLFLNKNEIFVETNSFSSSVGKASNLNNLNFSGNLGLDFDYKINKNLYFNVAPKLKIHTSTFSKDANNFKPYIFGVYTGLNYKF